MSAGVSDFGAAAWVQMMFGVVDVPENYWIALCNDEPGTGMDGTIIAALEPTDSAYGRVEVATGPSDWAASDNYLTNINPIDFGVPTEDWGRITDFAICSAATDGELYAWGMLVSPQWATAGYSIILPPGGIVVALAALENSIAI